jgi:hypothetical protein
MDVVSAGIGDGALTTLDGLPDLELVCRVAVIGPLGGNWRGGMTYRAIVEPQVMDERMRWNMGA